MPRKPDTNKKDRYNDPFPSALRELVEENKTTQEVLKTVLNVNNRQSVTGYIDGSTLPTIDKLVALAKHFGVSSDYLLGLSGGVKSPNAEIRAICDYTGLSEESVEYLHKQVGRSSELFTQQVLNDLLSTEIIFGIGFSLAQSLRCYSIGVSNPQNEESIVEHLLPINESEYPEGGVIPINAFDASDFYKERASRLFWQFIEGYVLNHSKNNDQNTEK